MRSIIKKILKEETEPEFELTDLEKKGVDITFGILKKRYTYLKGWKFIKKGKFELDLLFICDIEKLCQFYDSDLKYYYKSGNVPISGEDYPYPFSILQIADRMNGDEKFELYKEMLEYMNEIYNYIPTDLKVTDKFNDIIKLNPDKFSFE